MTFKQWMLAIQQQIHKLTGGEFTIELLGDAIPLRDRFDDEVTPEEVAMEVLEQDEMTSWMFD